MAEIILHGHQIPYTHEIKPRLKHVYILINQKGLVVRSRRLAQPEIDRILHKKAKWILKKLANYTPPVQENRDLNSEQKVAFLGKWYTLELVKKDQDIPCLFKISGAHLQLIYAENIDISIDWVNEALTAYYRLQAEYWMGARLDYWSEVMALYPNKIRFKKLKSRWGSCSAKGNLNLNIRAMILPEACIDAILVHELAHLKHMNHSTRFWNFVESFIPDYKIRNKELKSFWKDAEDGFWL